MINTLYLCFGAWKRVGKNSGNTGKFGEFLQRKKVETLKIQSRCHISWEKGMKPGKTEWAINISLKPQVWRPQHIIQVNFLEKNYLILLCFPKNLTSLCLAFPYIIFDIYSSHVHTCAWYWLRLWTLLCIDRSKVLFPYI